MAVIYGKLASIGKLTGKITLIDDRLLKGFLTVPQGTGEDVPEYQGPYTVTPATYSKVLNTNGFKMTSNVTVEPIPPNYGLITWNGSTLFIS